jgi:hypothetical protein
MRGMGKKRDALRLMVICSIIDSKELAKVSSSYGEPGSKENGAKRTELKAELRIKS